MAQVDSENMVVIDRVYKSWASATAAWRQYRTTSQGNGSPSSELDSTMDSVGNKVIDAYDVSVDVLGKQFVKGDDVFESDMNALERGLLSQLYASLRELSSNSHRQTDSSNDHEAEAKKLAVEALARTVHILELLALRLGYKRPQSQSSTPGQDSLFDDSDDIDWCKGALLNQQSSANYQSTITQSVGKQSKTCKFCYLEISDYRVKAIRYTDEDWSALASCHVLACSSFKDRRAAYRCFGCYVRGLSRVQASAAAMSDHIASCSEFIEKRARPQIPTKAYGRVGPAPPSPPLTPYADNLGSSAASTPSTPSTYADYSHGPTPDESQSQQRAPSLPVPAPKRNPPPVPPTPQTGPAYSLRPDTDASAHRIPGGFPTVQPSEPVHSQQSPINVSASKKQDPSQSPPGNTPPLRRAGLSQEQRAAPRHPPVNSPLVNSPNPKRANRATFSPDPSPYVPQVPTQVQQLMVLGASRAEAESRLRESNWDIQKAADLYLNSATLQR